MDDRANIREVCTSLQFILFYFVLWVVLFNKWQAVCSMSSLGSFSLFCHLNHFFGSFPWLVGNEEGAEAQGAILGFCKVGACGSNQEDTYFARPFGKYYSII